MTNREKQNLIFFLGGHDAEMITIRELLHNNDISEQNIKDKNLKWGAKLSEYKEDLGKLTDKQTAVLIELTVDDKNLLPRNYKIIDHHNENAGANKKTSLEQIAELLGVEFSRWQQLISANDRGHKRTKRIFSN